jgi:hypothetical protein
MFSSVRIWWLLSCCLLSSTRTAFICRPNPDWTLSRVDSLVSQRGGRINAGGTQGLGAHRKQGDRKCASTRPYENAGA